MRRGVRFDGRGRFFAAASLGISPSTADSHWAYAPAWLRQARSDVTEQRPDIRRDLLYGNCRRFFGLDKGLQIRQ